MEHISNYQLFSLLCLYEIGTTIIFGFSSSAGRAAWIPVLLSAAVGILINIIYITIMKMNKGLTLVEWYPAQFGKIIGLPIAWIYVLEFMYDSARAIADLDIIVPDTILPKTPVFIIQLSFSILTAYALFSGIESIARLGEIFMPLLFLVYITELFLIFGSDIMHQQYIMPILGKGWKTIFSSVWPLGITQTFGQTIEFSMVWPLIDNQKKILKTTILATLISGIFIAVIDAFSILVLGENTFMHSLFPIFRTIRIISVGNFIENLDVINILFFLTTAFFKCFFHLWCAVRAIQILTYSKSSRTAVIPVVSIVLFVAVNMASNSAEHLKTGIEIVPYSLWVPLFYVLPIVLLLVTWLRKKLFKEDAIKCKALR